MIHLQVRDEKYRVLVRGSRGLDWPMVGELDEQEFPMLGGLLPFADTMFNSRQATRLRGELARPAIRSAFGDDLVAEIERLCRQVEDGSHLYLWFLGD